MFLANVAHITSFCAPFWPLRFLLELQFGMLTLFFTMGNVILLGQSIGSRRNRLLLVR